MESIETLSRLTIEQPLTSEAQKFDYNALSQETIIIVQECTSKIKVLVRRTAQDLICIGENLTEVKQQLGHGNFMNWLKSEFDWSISAATRYMQVSEKFKFVNLANLEIAASALYLLAAPSTTEAVLQEALEGAIRGEAISHTKVKAIATQHKEAGKSKTPKPVTVDAQAEIFEKQPEGSADIPVIDCLHDTVLVSDRDDCPLEDQIEKDIQSLFEVGNLVFLTDSGQQEPKFLGEVAEVKEATATDVIVRISVKISTY